MQRFREPDYEGKELEHAIWYDPTGEEYATEVEGQYVREYCPLPDTDERIYVCIETWLEDPPRDLRARAALGVQQIAERGGEESYVKELPKG